MLRLSIMLLATSILIKTCRSSGKMSITLVNYHNPGGKLNDGSICDIFMPCDFKFLVCLDHINGSSSDMSQCNYGRRTLKNEPKKISFDEWPGGALLKVKVTDYDLTNADDLVEILSINVTINASRSRSESSEHLLTVKNRTTLNLTIAVFCDDKWCGPKCNKNESNCDHSRNDNIIPKDKDNVTGISEVQQTTELPTSQTSEVTQGTKMKHTVSTSSAVGVLVGSIISGLVLVIAGLVIWKVCQRQSEISQVQAYKVGLDDIEPYGISTSPPGPPMIDDNPYSDIDERKATGRNTYCNNMREGAANDTHIYINQHEETQTEANAYLNPRDDVQANTYLELLPNQREETEAEANAYTGKHIP